MWYINLKLRVIYQEHTLHLQRFYLALRFYLAITTMPLAMGYLFPRHRFGYPEKVTFWVDDWITLSVVIPNDGNGKYFKVMLEKEAFITGYDPVEGFVSPKHAFKVELEQGVRCGQIMVTETNFYHCYTCWVIPWEYGLLGSPRRGW